MKILLISPNMSQPPVMPIGMRYVAEAATDAGHQVLCLDLCFENPARVQEVIAQRIKKFNPQIIGISLRNLDVENPDKIAQYNYANYNLATYNLANYNLSTCSPETDKLPSNLDCFDRTVETCRRLSQANIILGGPAFTLMPKQFLQRYPGSIGVVGPGEEAFLCILANIEKGKDIDDIQHVVTAESSDEDFTQISTASLPKLPNTEETELTTYLSRAGEYNIQSKRGCAFKCIHCSYPLIEGNIVRTHEPKEISGLMARLTERGIRRFRFVDSVFNNPVNHAIAVCQAISERVTTQVEFIVNCSPAHFTHDLAMALKQAGCSKIIFGTDTASTTMLKIMRKPFTKTQIQAATYAAKSADLYFEHHMLLGGPGETLETALESLEFMSELDSPVFIDLGIQIYDRAPIAKLLQSKPASNSELVPPIFVEPTVSEVLPELIIEFCTARPMMHTFIVSNSGALNLEDTNNLDKSIKLQSNEQAIFA